MSIATVIAEIVAEHAREGRSPEAINGGWCEDFAEAVVQTLIALDDYRAIVVRDDWFTAEGEEEGFWRHAWVYYRGRHYDSETPDGVADWMTLPYFVRHESDPDDAGGNFPGIRRRESRRTERRRLDASVAEMVKVLRATRCPQPRRRRRWRAAR